MIQYFRFEVGKKYRDHYVENSDYEYTCIKKTTNTATFQGPDGKTFRMKVEHDSWEDSDWGIAFGKKGVRNDRGFHAKNDVQH